MDTKKLTDKIGLYPMMPVGYLKHYRLDDLGFVWKLKPFTGIYVAYIRCMNKYYQGKFTPKNPKKYLGDPTIIVFRSNWEKRVMTFLDEMPSILAWNSEEIVVPYLSPLDGRIHRYFPDFYVKFRQKDGTIKEMLWEIKPHKETEPPKQPKRVTQKYITEVAKYGVNQAKWEAANNWCKQHGMEFKVLTENDLGIHN